MEIEQQSFKRSELVIINGRVDSTNWQELEDAFLALQSDGKYNIVVDLEAVTWFTTAGLRVLVAAFRECKNHGGDLKLASPSKRMADVLSIAGHDTMFSIFDDRTSAIGSF
jgi:anti-anti-sigma factor